MGKRLHEIQQLFKGRPVDLHGHVLGIEDDAVLIVVNVGRVLQAPRFAADRDGDNAVVCPGGVVHAPGIALVLPAQLALGVGRLRSVFRRGNGLGVLLGLAQIDGDVHFAILAFVLPAHIFRDAVASDVVGVTAELVVPVRGLLRADSVLFLEGTHHFPGHRRHRTHNPGVENIPGCDVVLAQALGCGVVQNAAQDFLQVFVLGLIGGFIIVLAQNIQQTVGEHLMVHRLGKPPVHGVGNKGIDAGFNFHASTSISTPP